MMRIKKQAIQRFRVLWCRIFGHTPVVNGWKSLGTRRWVECGRCAARPAPEGALDPDQWKIGDRYTGPMDAVLPDVAGLNTTQKIAAVGLAKIRNGGKPGSWPTRTRSEA